MRTCLCLLALLAASSEVVAQIAVQLPTYSTFSVNTTVSVPDRGGMWLGGGGQSAFGGLRSAPPGQMLRTVRQGAAGVGVSAWVHDHAALDRATLGQAKRTVSASASRAALAPALPAAGAQSIAELRRQREAEKKELAARAVAQQQMAQSLRAAKSARMQEASRLKVNRSVKPAAKDLR
ncbi:MAG: hypothetical protein U0836_04110 [Pirellulales bacterium]